MIVKSSEPKSSPHLLLLLSALVCVASLTAWSTAHAQAPLAIEDVPEDLQAWIPWALDGNASGGCPWIGYSRQCLWPGRLTLDIVDGGGDFRVQVRADRPGLLKLPGGPGMFPRDVTLNGRPAPLLNKDDEPTIQLEAGTHEIRGRFATGSLSELLPVPASFGLIDLRFNGEPTVARRNQDGELWLEAAPSQSPGEEGRVELEVFRKLSDGVPFTLTTRVVIRASGEAREIELGSVGIEGVIPTELDSDLAARLDPESGTLTIQARPGTFHIDIVSRGGEPLSSIASISQSAPWPSEEIWVWEPDETLRQVEVSGADSIDASRTNLPDSWKNRSAYIVRTDTEITLTATRRGEPEAPPNSLSLERRIWLDMDGNGFTGRDHISGTLNRDWRLDLLSGELGRAAIGTEDLLITNLNGQRGVEVRERSLSRFEADWRLEDSPDSLPAVGWSEDVQSLSTSLYLPPGWTLLAASGVDDVPGTWLDQWDLWSIFFVLIISLAVFRLSTLPMGIAMLFALVLCYHEAGSPFWALLFFIPMLGLRKVIPAGAIQPVSSAAFWVSAAVLIWVATPFTVSQMRNALFPFTATHSSSWIGMEGANNLASPLTLESHNSEPEMDEDQSVPAAAPTSRSARPSRAGGSRPYARGITRRASPPENNAFDPNALVQTGPGIPRWDFNLYELEWSGPVRADHSVQLYLLPPWAFRLISLLRLLLLGGVLLLLLTRYRPTPPGKRSPPLAKPSGATTAATAAAAICSLAFLAPGISQAQMPSDARLDELASRLQRAPACGSDCVLATEASVRLADDSITIDIEVHASAPVGYPLPGPSGAWVPQEVRVDGASSEDLVIDDDGFLFVRLDEGVHNVQLRGPVNGDVLTLAFGAAPMRVTAQLDGWDVDGIREDGQASESIQLIRRADATPTGDTIDDEALPLTLPAWFRVERRFELGVRWAVVTTVQRVTPLGTPGVVRLPLLPGESVTDATVQVQDDHVIANLSRSTPSLSWSSTLEPTDGLALRAASGTRYSETWKIRCTPIWRCVAAGIAPDSHGSGRVETTYRPWPGEEVSIAAERPLGADGQSSTIDSAHVFLSPGIRMMHGSLRMEVRASRGGTQTLELPPDSTVQTLTVNGSSRAIQQTPGGQLSVGIEPGTSNISLEWQQPGGVEAYFQSPVVRLGESVANATVRIEMPEDRWILWAQGPHTAVAVLFWPYLCLVLLFAFLLSRSRTTPLRFLDWSLLGLGLTQIPALAAIIVVGWFFLMGIRRQRPEIDSRVFPLRQAALGFYSCVAVCCLYAALHAGLLMQPDMQITSLVGGDGTLQWYVDRTNGELPQPSVFSVPLWVWRVGMLLWALWLAARLFKWGKWGWESFAMGGWITGGIQVAKPASGSPTPAPPLSTVQAPSSKATATPEERDPSLPPPLPPEVPAEDVEDNVEDDSEPSSE